MGQQGKLTRRKRFLAEMNPVVPWEQIFRRIRSHYVQTGQGRQPHPLEIMLRIHCQQHFFNLSDPAAEDALYDPESICHFAGLELARRDSG